MQNLTGKILSSRYRLESIIGEGGMGIVYRGFDSISQKVVAIKVLKGGELLNRVENLVRLKREAVMLSRLDNPGIVQVFDIATHDIFHYLVVEYIAGETLTSFMQARKKLSIDCAVQIVKEISLTLSYIHEQGIVHGDIKPGNILLSKNEESAPDEFMVKICDFGLSRFVNRQEQLKTSGTYYFMSPEQLGILRAPVESRTDLYSLGVVFYYLLTGRLPFSGCTLHEFLTSLSVSSPVHPSTLRSDIPGTVDMIVGKLICKDPEQRYRTAAGLSQDLEDVLRKKPVIRLSCDEAVRRLHYHTRFIGRNDRLDILQKTFWGAVRGSGSVCSVAGDAGSGKSRLLDEFSGWATGNGANCFHTVCLRREDQVPYQLFTDIILQYVSYAAMLPVSLQKECYSKIRMGAGECVGLLSKLDPCFAELFPDAPEITPLDAEKERQRFISLCASVVASLGDPQKPLVLFLDDLQWVDPGSMEILFDLWMRIATLPLLVIGSYRKNELSPGHPVTKYETKAALLNLPLITVPLERLSVRETGELLSSLVMSNESWIAPCAEFIFRKCLGNTLATLEVIRQLVGAEVLYWKGDRWRCNKDLFPTLSIPDAITDNILTRIAASDKYLHDILSVAALCGKEFDTGQLIRLVNYISKETIVELLDKAVELDLVVWDKRKQGLLVFAHDRIRDVFVMRLSAAEKSHYHKVIGSVLESEHPQPVKEVVFLLVHHFYHAEMNEKCLPYALAAAELSKEGLAVSSAIYYYELVVKLIGEPLKQKTDAWKIATGNLIELYPLDSQVEKAIALAEQCVIHAETPVARAHLHHIIGVNCTKISSFIEAEKHFATALKLCGKKIPGSPFAALFFSAWQFTSYYITKPLWPLFGHLRKRKTTEKERKIIQIYQGLSTLYLISNYLKYFWVTLALMNYARRKVGASKELAGALSSYAMIVMAIPWMKRCRFHHDQALAMYESVGFRPGIAEVKTYLGFAYTIMADWEHALRFIQQARVLLESIGDQFQMIHVLNCLQNIYYLQGETEKRFPVLKALLTSGETIGNRYGSSIALSGLGGHYYVLGEHALSESFLDKSIELSEHSGQWNTYCVANSVKTRLLLDQEKFERAEECIAKAEAAEREHSLLRPVIGIRYVVAVQLSIALYQKNKAGLSPGERISEIALLAKKVRRMRQATGRWPLWNGDSSAMVARYLECIGKASRAEKEYCRAMTTLSLRGKKFELALCRYSYGIFLNENNRPAEAELVLTKALTLFREMGAKWYCTAIEKILNIPTVPVVTAENESAERLATLIAVSRSIGAGKGIDVLLDEILGKAVTITGASRGVLFILDERGVLDIRAKRSHDDTGGELQFSRNIAEKVHQTGQTIITANASQQEAYRQYESVLCNDLKSIICVPVKWQGKIIGICYLDNPVSVGVFGDEDREVLEALMGHAAISIENARAFEALRIHNDRLALERNRAVKRSAELKSIVEFNAGHVKTFGEFRLVTQDSAMAELIEMAKRYADAQAPVLITGESGTGKEVFSHLIHHEGRRNGKPFVKVNCSAIPETLFEAEFFGYERGAFTGAIASRPGKFELANGGTLMLDEIAELPLAQQTKLLRVLEEHEITPVGASTAKKIDVRIIAATNTDLKQLIAQEKFREDLYFRIGVLHIVIPPLAERIDDIPVLAAYFLSTIANVEGGREKKFDDAALTSLRSIPFQGNVRQLRSLVYRLYVLFDKETITADDVAQVTRDNAGDPDSLAPDAADMVLSRSFVMNTLPYNRVKEAFERQYLGAQLEKHGSNVTRTAQAIGLLPSALSRKLKELGIVVQRGASTRAADAKGGEV